MAAFGPDFGGGLMRSAFTGRNPAGFWTALAIAIGLLILGLALQVGFGVLVRFMLYGPQSVGVEQAMAGMLMGVLPAALCTAAVAYWAAGLRGGHPAEVLNLRLPHLGAMGWAVVIVGFYLTVIVLFAIALGILSAFGVKPNAHGVVENTMSGLTDDPRLYLLVVPSIALGAPIWEEVLFRGQIFTALTKTRLGYTGTILATSAAWASMHYSGNWITVLLIFIMGLALGYLLVRFGSLWVPMACHALWNSVTSLALYAANAPQ